MDVRPGLQDAGAASNSVKPHIAYSAYVQPGKKKEKKKVQRTRFNETRHTFRNKSGATQQAASKPPSSPAPVASPAPATASAAVATPSATPAASTPAPSASNAQVAANTPSSKPVKKQKVRFGQAPTGTLDNAPGNTPTTAAAAPPAETQVASNETSASDGLATAVAVKKQKTRFSSRAGEAKQPKAATQDQLENQSQGKASTEEAATQQTQAAPLGLGGDTATKKKPVKVKSDVKTRLADKPKTPSDDQKQDQKTDQPLDQNGAASGDMNPGAAATSHTTPEAGAPATSSAPPASTPDERAPLDTTPAQPGQTAPAAPSTPATSPQ